MRRIRFRPRLPGGDTRSHAARKQSPAGTAKWVLQGFCLVAWLSASVSASAQGVALDTVAVTDTANSGTIRGVVRTQDGAPVVDAQITIERFATVRSDSAGRFFALRVPVGRYEITARTFGAPATRTVVTLARGDTATITMVVAARINELQAVRTIGERIIRNDGFGALEDFYRRRQRGFGKFFDRKQLEATLTFDQLIRSNMAGVRITYDMMNNPTFVFARCPPLIGMDKQVMFFIDGMPTVGDDLFNTFRPSDLEAMEIYRGVSELPAEARGNTCAAVYLWTRR